MRFDVIVAARLGSRRLPAKALLPLCGVPMIRLLLRRIKGTTRAANLVLATTERAEDDALAAQARAEGVAVFRGASDDVVRRYDDAAGQIGAEYVVRVTGDCPFIDSDMLDYCLAACDTLGAFDLATTKGAFPTGLDCEIYRAESLRRLHQGNALSASDREHLTKYFYDHPSRFQVATIEPRSEWRCASRRFTIDTPEDYQAARSLVDSFADPLFRVAELVARAKAQ